MLQPAYLTGLTLASKADYVPGNWNISLFIISLSSLIMPHLFLWG